ncbi:MAG: hypothetical protein MUD14_00825 [Hydrococcus sp. Prado102]|nr:hypothetical protein [Hydrococcus sp. Prado102]
MQVFPIPSVLLDTKIHMATVAFDTMEKASIANLWLYPIRKIDRTHLYPNS